MELIKVKTDDEIFASNGCTSGCKAICTAEQRPTSESNGTIKAKGSNPSK